MVKFYNKWKKYNEIQLTKNKMDLNKYSKNDKSSALPRNNEILLDAVLDDVKRCVSVGMNFLFQRQTSALQAHWPLPMYFALVYLHVAYNVD